MTTIDTLQMIKTLKETKSKTDENKAKYTISKKAYSNPLLLRSLCSCYWKLVLHEFNEKQLDSCKGSYHKKQTYLNSCVN